MIDVSVLVVNYNTSALVKKCIESLKNQREVRFEIIVVDNNSQDDSAAVLKQFGDDITLVLNTDNKGFGTANNQAFRLSRGRYLFMLNPDAVCTDEMNLFHAARFMDAHPQCGLAGTRIVNDEGQIEHTVFYHYPREKQTRADFSSLPGKIATVLGASMLARREVFEKINGFDESFFLYGEETDLCLRIRKAGHEIGYCENVTVRHVGSASEKGNPREEVIRKKKAGKLLFYQKHYPLQDVASLVKQDLRHARFHLFRLSLLKLCFGLTPRQDGKYRQHKVARDLALHFLKSVYPV
ncbi:N-acetylglucosaminyl-diphospho-decaprenol L-rhamnosyltransferase [Aquicella siphonis]|uniref:N-acetylglucosaminyl-diphospho-decaprenol L-rhamnosyltransferase n=1 Tax=Aquicella siphonis TaxID=254247 RepID=A0A5E4PIF6_9COXI|nr:glycosyltransferase family 2 protein [Aquicella siphonis]VVC76355.1 N-acetylglucosaminyl-diphospho-decaprenol L-rhamnosyltransferase [Aquicella siphonis]